MANNGPLEKGRNLLIMLSKSFSQNDEQKRLPNLQQKTHKVNQMSSSRNCSDSSDNNIDLNFEDTGNNSETDGDNDTETD